MRHITIALLLLGLLNGCVATEFQAIRPDGDYSNFKKDKFECRSEAQKAYSEFVPRDFIQDAVYESKKNNFYKECMEARGYEMKEKIKTQ